MNIVAACQIGNTRFKDFTPLFALVGILSIAAPSDARAQGNATAAKAEIKKACERVPQTRDEQEHEDEQLDILVSGQFSQSQMIEADRNPDYFRKENALWVLCTTRARLAQLSGRALPLHPEGENGSTRVARDKVRSDEVSRDNVRSDEVSRDNVRSNENANNAQNRRAENSAREDTEPPQPANECVSLNPKAKLYGGFRNSCPFKVNVTYCAYQPKKGAWNELFNCEKGGAGLDDIRANGTRAAHTNGTKMYWFACKAPAMPNGTYFTPQGMYGRCK